MQAQEVLRESFTSRYIYYIYYIYLCYCIYYTQAQEVLRESFTSPLQAFVFFERVCRPSFSHHFLASSDTLMRFVCVCARACVRGW